MQFPVVIEHDEDGYFASCPTLQGCFTQGDTYEEAEANIREAIAAHIEDRAADGEPIFAATAISISMVHVPDKV